MRRIGDDRGATSVLVALFVAALMIPMTAIVVDVGGMYSERRRLQNSADSGAMAVAISCVSGTACDKSEAQTFATKNNLKLGVDVEDDSDGSWPCGTMGGLSPCTPDPRCEAQPSSDKKYVEVLVTSKDETWTPILLPESTKNVSACARATLSGLGGAKGLPLTVSACEWLAATGEGATYAPPGPYDGVPAPVFPDVSYERILKLHTTSGVPTCDAGPSGADAPGGFGWLDYDENCVATSEVDDKFEGDPGVSLPKPCKDEMESIWNNKEPIFIPVYNQVTGTGNNTEYTIEGYAAFVLTGYNLPSGKQKSWLTGDDVCKGSDKCVAGFFTQALVPPSGVHGGGPNMGATTVQMIL